MSAARYPARRAPSAAVLLCLVGAVVVLVAAGAQTVPATGPS